MTDDNTDLEALFDSIAYGRTEAAAEEPAAAPADDPSPGGADNAEKGNAEHVFACAAHTPSTCPADKVINSVGHLTRRLHDTLVELGYDRQLQECAAGALPDARQRLAYVATLTEQAASRSLNAVELAVPVQEQLASEATALAVQVGQRFRRPRRPAGTEGSRRGKPYLPARRAGPDGPDAQSPARHHAGTGISGSHGPGPEARDRAAEDLEKQLLMLLVENASGTGKRNEGCSGCTVRRSTPPVRPMRWPIRRRWMRCSKASASEAARIVMDELLQDFLTEARLWRTWT